MLVIFFSCSGLIHAKNTEPSDYSFTSNLLSEKDKMIQFTYKNKSNYTQCIRYEDLTFNLLGDAMYVRLSTGEPMKYVGPTGRTTPSKPQVLFILSPGADTTASIKLSDFYKLQKGKNIYVSYSIPVIPCQYLMEKYVGLPPPVFMKSKINDPTAEKTDVYAIDYPEWTQYGFIAVSTPLLINN